jgi:hypothetical protein
MPTSHPVLAKRTIRGLAVTGAAIAVLALAGPLPSLAAATPVGPVAHAAGGPPSISTSGADAGTPDGLTKTRVVVFVTGATTAKLTKIAGYRFQPGAPFGSPPTALFATSGAVALHHVSGSRWEGHSTNPRAFRAVSAEAWRVKLYVHACNSAGCSSLVITLDRRLNG